MRKQKHFHPAGQSESKSHHPVCLGRHPFWGALVFHPPELVSLVPVLVLVLGT